MEIIEILANNKADFSIKNAKGKTVFDVANPELRDLLKKEYPNQFAAQRRQEGKEAKFSAAEEKDKPSAFLKKVLSAKTLGGEDVKDASGESFKVFKDRLPKTLRPVAEILFSQKDTDRLNAIKHKDDWSLLDSLNKAGVQYVSDPAQPDVWKDINDMSYKELLELARDGKLRAMESITSGATKEADQAREANATIYRFFRTLNQEKGSDQKQH
jgi:hypothetical protein